MEKIVPSTFFTSNVNCNEYFSAREFQMKLQYKEWRNFFSVICKAKVICSSEGHDIGNHFISTKKIVKIANGALRSIDDYNLSNYACHLILKNCDTHKENVINARNTLNLSQI